MFKPEKHHGNIHYFEENLQKFMKRKTKQKEAIYHAVLILLHRVSSTDRNNSFGLAAVYLAEILLMDPSEKLTFGSSDILCENNN